MVTLESLYDIADSEGVDILHCTFSKTKKAACMCTGSGKHILLDRAHIETTSEEKVILAEEISHYETNAFYTVRSNVNERAARCNRLRQEAKAQQHSYARIVPPNELAAFLQKNKTASVYDTAEHFEITYECLERAINYYQTKGYAFMFGAGE